MDRDKRLAYGQFIDLLNTLKDIGLITAKQRRDYDQRWRTTTENRKNILEELGAITDSYNEQTFSQHVT